jgi:hypothetical protein
MIDCQPTYLTKLDKNKILGSLDDEMSSV